MGETKIDELSREILGSIAPLSGRKSDEMSDDMKKRQGLKGMDSGEKTLKSGRSFEELRISPNILASLNPKEIGPNAKTAEQAKSKTAFDLRNALSSKLEEGKPSADPVLSVENKAVSGPPNFATSVDLEEVNTYFRYGALIGLSMWVGLLFIVMKYAPADSFEAPEGLDQSVHATSFLLLLITNGSRILPLALRQDNLRFMRSGVLFGTISVQLIAMLSNILMAYYPTPVMLDPISGLRFHLVRWAEWTPLAFVMSFLTCNVDAPLREKGKRVHIVVPICVCLAAFQGMLFPFCPNFFWWMVVMIVSWAFFAAIIHLVYSNRTRYNELLKTTLKTSFEQEERIALARSSYVLSVSCSFTWTILSLAFTLICLAPTYAPPGSFLAHPALPVFVTAFFEIASKIWYLSILIDAYEKIFDEQTRAVRKLEDLRNVMSTVWGASSDVIVFCNQREDQISVRISPAYVNAVTATLDKRKKDVSLLMEVFPSRGEFFAFELDLSKPVTREDAAKFKKNARPIPTTDFNPLSNLSIEDENLASVAKLVLTACRVTVTDATILLQEFKSLTLDGRETTKKFEAKIIKIEEQSLVIFLHDVSDRIRRFEAEKRLIREAAMRKKDAQANKFNRHEVKNGILAAIGLYDHIKETLENKVTSQAVADSSRPLIPQEIQESFQELGSTLKDVLDTILDDAMAKEIVYGEYKPKKEVMDVVQLVDSLRGTATARFPLRMEPSPFPQISIDRQLFCFIYRNALSNACRYGKASGIVQTHMHFDAKKKRFVLEVVNQPGQGHEKLVSLGAEEVASVFFPETQLSATSKPSESSGNGAWIQQRCAETLGGKCKIRFELTGTVFTFDCPIDEFKLMHQAPKEKGPFSVPAGTWGVAIDDSRIQRKLMDRTFDMVGVEKSRRLVVGGTAKEINCFCDTVVGLMTKYPDDKFLLIADENLDLENELTHKQETVFGSILIETLRSRLDEQGESRLLSLVRSASNSVSDIEVYKSRAHGFLQKELIQKDRIMNEIQQRWDERFSTNNFENSLQKTTSPAGKEEITLNSVLMQS